MDLPVILAILFVLLGQDVLSYPQKSLFSYRQHNAKTYTSSHKSQSLHAFQKLNANEKNEFPLAVFVAGIKEDSLEVVDDILAGFLYPLPPVIVLGNSDSSILLDDILSQSSSLLSRDHELPEKPFKTEVPVILFSGLENSKVVNIVKQWKYVMKNEPSSNLPECAFAMVVSPALKKTFKQLLGEISRDHIENRAL